jgi:hypothetical protein
MRRPDNENEGKGFDDSFPKKRKSRWGSLLAILVGVAVIIIISRKNKNEPDEVAPQPRADTAAQSVAAPPVADATAESIAPLDLEKVLKKLEGKWQRTDGGYVIEFENPAPDGKIEAGYFNPKPIHVGRSGWQYSAGKIIVAVELQDENYPGSLYTLQFFPRENLLAGTYFQAVEKVNYDVEFTRMK